MTKTWTLETVKNEVIKFIEKCEDIYGRKFDKTIEVRINGRLTKTLGYFAYKGKKSLSIDIAKRLLESNKNELIIDTIGHEVAHYIMHELGYYNEKHGERFKRLCGKLGLDTKAVGFNSKILQEQSMEIRKAMRERKKNEGRYIVMCSAEGCEVRSYFKVARKDSIENWLTRYYCPEHGYSLICYDKKERLKYWFETDWTDEKCIECTKMTKEEIEKYC